MQLTIKIRSTQEMCEKIICFVSTLNIFMFLASLFFHLFYLFIFWTAANIFVLHSIFHIQPFTYSMHCTATKTIYHHVNYIDVRILCSFPCIRSVWNTFDSNCRRKILVWITIQNYGNKKSNRNDAVYFPTVFWG